MSETPTETPESPKSNKGLIIGLAIGIPLLIGAGVAGYFINKNIQDKKAAEAAADAENNIEEVIAIEEPTTVDSLYYVVVGAYENYEYAERHSKKSADFEVIEEVSELGTYRVRSNEVIYDNFDEAYEVAQDLRNEGSVEGAWVYQEAK